MLDPHADLLPDSRLQVVRGAKWSAAWGCMAMPIFCANCGKNGGYVPEANCDFACWLCNDCVREHPLPLGLHVTPDEAFWAKVAEDMGLVQSPPATPPAIPPAFAAPLITP